MNLAHVWIDWTIKNIYRFDLDIELLNPTPEEMKKGLIYWQWHFDFTPPPPKMQGGYIGFQLVKSKKIAIFSIWEAIRGKPPCSRFTHEGEGIQCLVPFNWILEKKYRLTVKEGTSTEEGTWWIGEIHDYSNSQTNIIGKILIPNDFDRLSPHNYYTCVEYGYFNDDCENLPHTKARFSSHYAYNGKEDGSARLRAGKPKIEYPSECKNSKITFFEDYSYIIEAGNRVTRK